MPSCTSPRASSITFPISIVSSRASCSFRSFSNKPTLYNTSARFGAGTSAHFFCAAFAALTAASTSAAADNATSPIVSPFAGLITGAHWPLKAGCHFPLIKFNAFIVILLCLLIRCTSRCRFAVTLLQLSFSLHDSWAISVSMRKLFSNVFICLTVSSSQTVVPAPSSPQSRLVSSQ